LRASETLFLQLVIIVNYKNFDYYFQLYDFYHFQVQKAITTLQDYINDSLDIMGRKEKIRFNTQTETNRLMGNIFSSGFFQMIGQHIFYN